MGCCREQNLQYTNKINDHFFCKQKKIIQNPPRKINMDVVFGSGDLKLKLKFTINGFPN